MSWFVLDVTTPNRVVDGFLSISAVLVGVWVPAANAALYTAPGPMLLVVLGFFLSPIGADTLWAFGR